MTDPPRPRPGRPAVPDQQVIDGARRALVADPSASMADIARESGVGMSALYARFRGRQALLEHFADEGNRLYGEALDRAEAGLADGRPPLALVRELVTEVALADVYRVWLAVAGSFERTRADLRESVELRDRGRALLARCHEAGVLRPGVTWNDLGKVQEMIAVVQGADAARTRDLRLRMLDVVLTGLTRGGHALPGQAATAEDFAENRAPSHR